MQDRKDIISSRGNTDEQRTFRVKALLVHRPKAGTDPEPLLPLLTSLEAGGFAIH